MDIIATRVADAGVARGESLNWTGDGTIVNVNLGFRPKYVKIVNITGVITYEKIDGMAANASIQTVTAGTTTIATNSAIVINDRGFTVAAALNVATNVFAGYAE